jgi:hypothetical protein
MAFYNFSSCKEFSNLLEFSKEEISEDSSTALHNNYKPLENQISITTPQLPSSSSGMEEVFYTSLNQSRVSSYYHL